jgi:hypothetical protein
VSGVGVETIRGLRLVGCCAVVVLASLRPCGRYKIQRSGRQAVDRFPLADRFAFP